MKTRPWTAPTILLSIAITLFGCKSSNPYRRFALPAPPTQLDPYAQPSPLAQPDQLPRSVPEPQPTPAVVPGVLPINPANTRIEFTGSTAIMSQSGQFTAFNGTLTVPSDNPVHAKIHVVLDVSSVKTTIPLLARHLKQEDFFDVAQYPRAEFVSEAITSRPEPGLYQVAGQLQFRGVTRRIEFPAWINVTQDEVSFDGTMTIIQTEFGMTEAAAKTKDEVPVRISIRSRRI